MVIQFIMQKINHRKIIEKESNIQTYDRQFHRSHILHKTKDMNNKRTLVSPVQDCNLKIIQSC